MRPSGCGGRHLKRGILVQGWIAGLAGSLLAGSALAGEEPRSLTWWQILEGQVKGKKLSGYFAGDAPGDPGELPEYVIVEGFALAAGRRTYGKSVPVEYEDAQPTVQPQSQIHFAGDLIDHFSLRANGEITGGGRNVEFRVLEFR